MRTLENITIENYTSFENGEGVMVEDMYVEYECNGEDYPFEYVVRVERNGVVGVGRSYQRDEWESAFHNGFVPAFCEAVGRLVDNEKEARA